MVRLHLVALFVLFGGCLCGPSDVSTPAMQPTPAQSPPPEPEPQWVSASRPGEPISLPSRHFHIAIHGLLEQYRTDEFGAYRVWHDSIIRTHGILASIDSRRTVLTIRDPAGTASTVVHCNLEEGQSQIKNLKPGKWVDVFGAPHPDTAGNTAMERCVLYRFGDL